MQKFIVKKSSLVVEKTPRFIKYIRQKLNSEREENVSNNSSMISLNSTVGEQQKSALGKRGRTPNFEAIHAREAAKQQDIVDFQRKRDERAAFLMKPSGVLRMGLFKLTGVGNFAPKLDAIKVPFDHVIFSCFFSRGEDGGPKMHTRIIFAWAFLLVQDSALLSSLPPSPRYSSLSALDYPDDPRPYPALVHFWTRGNDKVPSVHSRPFLLEYPKCFSNVSNFEIILAHPWSSKPKRGGERSFTRKTSWALNCKNTSSSIFFAVNNKYHRVQTDDFQPIEGHFQLCQFGVGSDPRRFKRWSGISIWSRVTETGGWRRHRVSIRWN